MNAKEARELTKEAIRGTKHYLRIKEEIESAIERGQFNTLILLHDKVWFGEIAALEIFKSEGFKIDIDGDNKTANIEW